MLGRVFLFRDILSIDFLFPGDVPTLTCDHDEQGEVLETREPLSIISSPHIMIQEQKKRSQITHNMMDVTRKPAKFCASPGTLPKVYNSYEST